MSKKILLGCYEIPGYGGASTAAYKLFELLQKDGFDVGFINIIDEQDAEYFRYMFDENFGNPDSLNNVSNYILKGDLFNAHPELSSFIRDCSPELLIGVDYIAPLLMKRAAPEKRSIFLTAGCEQVKNYISWKKGAIALCNSIARAKRPPLIFHRWEKETVEISDLIITHSDMIQSFYKYFYPYQSGKIYPEVIWKADWIYKGALEFTEYRKPFPERDIDLIFVASSWNRWEKNYRLVEKIASKCKDLNIHLVGEIEKKIPSVSYHGLLTERKRLFALLGNSKTIVAPSIHDAAPGILYEASAMECNIIASKNCGNWMICNEKLLADPPDLRNFLEKIHLSLTVKFNDNIHYFLKTNSYQNLKDIIEIF